MKNDNLDVILYELMQADSLGDEEVEAEVISFNDGGFYTLFCC